MSRQTDRLPRAIGERLKAAGRRIGLVETATGGAVSDRLTDVAGSSAYFSGALNPRAPEALERWLPRPAGRNRAPRDSATLARSAAAWIRADLDLDLGVAVTGDPAADGSASAATVWIAIHSPERQVLERRRFRGAPPQVQERAVRATLRLIHSCLEPPEATPSPR
jgi:nicotinamide mononucleotide (NMN) deamidase PncC